MRTFAPAAPPGCHGLADPRPPACDHGNLSGQGVCHESLLCAGTYHSESLRFMDETLCKLAFIIRSARRTAGLIPREVP